MRERAAMAMEARPDLWSVYVTRGGRDDWGVGELTGEEASGDNAGGGW